MTEKNTVCKGVDAGYQHFLLQFLIFSKCLFLKFVSGLCAGTVLLLINVPGAMQHRDREPLFCTQFNFVPNLQSKMSVKFSVSLCFRDFYDKILIKLEEISIKFCKYCYFNQLMFIRLS